MIGPTPISDISVKSQPYHSDAIPSIPEQMSDGRDDLGKLRELIVGKDYDELLGLKNRLEHPEQFTDMVAGIVSEALKKRSFKDDSLADALSITIARALHDSINKKPDLVVTAIFPILGPMIRKSIREALNGTLEETSRLLNQSLSLKYLRWRFEARRRGIPYSDYVLSKTLVYRVEQVFLIHRESGLLLAHAASDDIESKDPDVISGMLTAIADFIVDAFEEDSTEDRSIDSFQLGDLTVKVQAGPFASLALVVKGSVTRDLISLQHETLEYIHKLYGTDMQSFDGSIDLGLRLMPELEKCLLKQSQTEEKNPEKWKAVLFIIFILTGVGFWQIHYYQKQKLWRQEQLMITNKWQQVVNDIINEPGLVVIHQYEDHGKFYLSGLKDPMARKPEIFLPGRVAQDLDIGWRWSAYLSSEPEIVLKRLQEKVRIPVSISLEIVDQTLIVHGESYKSWLDELTQAARQTPGITNVVASDVLLLQSPEELFLAEARKLGSKQLFFEYAQDQLSEGQDSVLEEIVSLVENLYTMSVENHYPMQITIGGHCDLTGTMERNQVLSESRAEVVLEDIMTRSKILSNTGIFVTKGYSYLMIEESKELKLPHNRRVEFENQSLLLE